MNKTFYLRFFKRPFDLIVSIFAFIFFIPLYAILAFIVKINLGSPIIFKQLRPGLNGNIFHLYKFRTMSDKKDKDGNLLRDEFRLTKFGKLLRSTSLDELPSLFNIIKGDMSLVGPRPLLVEYLNYYNEEQKKRHSVKPGLTGYSQIMGRNSLNWEEKFKFDVHYIKNITFLNDLLIIFRTIIIVLRREGINNSSSVTMEKFSGTKSLEVINEENLDI
jgi:lipopolysaccharide/colanic/teichoic acid biosynthesis glycosyltransferase